ncbi:MAG: hypothetical protein QOI15_2102 [Pseudonocardiales bacterium]|nr:hypothetical protein [Pseudonocardiales bacterium]
MSTTIWPTIADAMNSARHMSVAPLTWDPVNHLLSRFTFGPTAAARASLAKSGPDAWYSGELAKAAQYRGYGGNAQAAAVGPLLTMSPYDVRQWLKAHDNEYGWDAMDQLTQVTLGLQGWSTAQLYETLVDFFSNHLNVPNHNGDVWNTRHAYDRDVIRRHAAGSFTDMLLASARHPAMLIYLSLAESTKTAVNENYGRELLELHTVGLHYSEDDVKATAKLLTGRTLDENQHYLFDDYIHWVGPVQILDFTHPNGTATGGQKAGDAFLRYLGGHPYTAQRLAQKLCVRFVSDTPSAALVNAVAKAYLDSNTQIPPMISTILRSTEFWQSRGKKIRRPAENLIATIRVLGLKVTNWPDALQALHWLSADLGHCPLDWPAPNGYPDVAAAWRSSGTLLDIWGQHLGLVGGWWDGLAGASIAALYGGAPANSGDAVARLTKRITGKAWSSADRAILQTFLDEPASTPMGSSVLRWWAEPLAAVILDGPHHALR